MMRDGCYEDSASIIARFKFCKIKMSIWDAWFLTLKSSSSLLHMDDPKPYIKMYQ